MSAKEDIVLRMVHQCGDDGYEEMAALPSPAARRRRAYYLYHLGLQTEKRLKSLPASFFPVGDEPPVRQTISHATLQSPSAAVSVLPANPSPAAADGKSATGGARKQRPIIQMDF